MTSKPRKRLGETVREFLQRKRRDHGEVPPLTHRLPALMFSWWFAVLFILLLIVIPVLLAILWTYPG